MKISIKQPLSFSEIGKKDNQEDYLYPDLSAIAKDQKFFILCDGMGGHENGEVASQTVATALGNYFEQNQNVSISKEIFCNALDSAYSALDAKDNTDSFKKMGTTMTCLCLNDDGALVAHIGDSRIYHIRPSLFDKKSGRLGILFQTSDHSLVNDLLKIGELTEEEARNYPHKNIITRAMQPNQERRAKADICQLQDIKKGDYFFLCCDGVLEQLTNEQLCEILANKKLSDQKKLDAIKSVCNGKTRDNYTCWLIPIGKVEKDEADEPNAEVDVILAVSEDAEEQNVVVNVPEVKKQQTLFSFLKSLIAKLGKSKIL